ncbi:hypothetical protein Pla52o_52230 [Novipirellula galeiformis]|uniref:Uncharacterized protein n=1 Tax=Novipirellula galeiformis TaxID=2528004 RepID=A0A5C6C3I8_9BACT|nr:hypothetical protein Pla52o_52230 [Novipirellula galeiformis]
MQAIGEAGSLFRGENHLDASTLFQLAITQFAALLER